MNEIKTSYIKISPKEQNVLKRTPLTNVEIMERIITNGHRGQIWRKSMGMIMRSYQSILTKCHISQELINYWLNNQVYLRSCYSPTYIEARESITERKYPETDYILVFESKNLSGEKVWSRGISINYGYEINHAFRVILRLHQHNSKMSYLGTFVWKVCKKRNFVRNLKLDSAVKRKQIIENENVLYLSFFLAQIENKENLMFRCFQTTRKVWGTATQIITSGLLLIVCHRNHQSSVE